MSIVELLPLPGVTIDLPLIVAVGAFGLSAAVLALFRPLLVGLVRAAILVVRPRLSKEQLAERARVRNLRVMQKMINASHGASHSAELRALAARA